MFEDRLGSPVLALASTYVCHTCAPSPQGRLLIAGSNDIQRFDNLALVSFLALFPGVVLSVDAHTGHLHVLHLCDVLRPLPTSLTTFCQDPSEPLISHAVVTQGNLLIPPTPHST